MFLDDLASEERLRGRGFERLCKWVLENASEYSSRLKNVWMWDEWPGRWGADAGIDLVAEDRGGGLWAIQAKHYDQAYAIKKSDLDSFLSESSRPGFSFRLLIASTDHLGSTARRTLDAQEKPVGTLLRSDLAALDLVWPSNLAELRPAIAKPKKAWPHQRRAVLDIIAGLEEIDRGQVLMACGTGKTLVARFLHDELSSTRTLVLVPSLSLLKQSLREWLSVGSFEYLAVCSDESVTPDEADAVVGSTSELGLPVTTDPAQISSFLQRRSGGVVFATYQSSPRIAVAMTDGTPWFDLVVADEAHRCAGPEAGPFATVLDHGEIRARKRVFMTATPRYFTGRVKRAGAGADWEVTSMDDEDKFGPVLHQLSFAEAIEQGLLSDYQVVVVGVTDSSYRDMAERGAFVTTDGEVVTDARTLARQIGLLRAIRNHDLHRVVSFHSRIRNASRFATSMVSLATMVPGELRPTGEFWAEHVSGEMTSGERELRLNRLRAIADDACGVLTNARCLAEGVDVPTLDGVAFIDPRRSQIDIVQAVGRAIRRADDKTIGTIIVPVFVDDATDAVDALESSEFDRVWEVVRALRGHDSVLGEELDECRRQLGRRGSLGHVPSKIVLDLPARVGDDFLRSFNSLLVTSTTSRWEFFFGLLEGFADREGTARVPGDHLEQGYRLGQWVGVQRSMFGKGRLRSERASLLAELPGWVWNENNALWDHGYLILAQYVEREGHALVPNGHVEDGHRLGSWVTSQRSRHRQHQLSDERVALLEALPGWEWNPLDDAWPAGFAALERFVSREGHTRVPKDHREDGYPLGQWAGDQRNWYRSGRLRPDRAAHLEALPGWEWNRYDAKWEKGFSLVERFAAAEGHTRIPRGCVVDGFRLGQWVSVQRTWHNAGRLTEERTARLQALPGWEWDTSASAWEQAFALLAQYVARERDARVPYSHVEDDFDLGGWVNRQMAAGGSGKLSKERRERLEALPRWTWNRQDTAWEEGCTVLERFVDHHGHARVPANHVEDGYKLGKWVSTQRTAHRVGRLSDERTARLEALPEWHWRPFDAQWADAYSIIQDYVTREGHARVPRDHIENDFRLGAWVKEQRSVYREARMPDDRVARLEALSGWAWRAS
jgi:superfamily II DNA or RNA helicase